MRWLAALIGASAVATSPVAAQSVSPSAAPAAWVRYAEETTRTITDWLEADSETAARLRTYLDATRPAPDQPTAPLVLKLWIGRDGTVSRIDFPPFAHPEPNADLRALIEGGRLTAVPPEDILLPLRILVELPPVSETDPHAAGAPGMNAPAADRPGPEERLGGAPQTRR